MKYRKCHREGMVKQFQQVRDHPEVCLLFAKFSIGKVPRVIFQYASAHILATCRQNDPTWFLLITIFRQKLSQGLYRSIQLVSRELIQLEFAVTFSRLISLKYDPNTALSYRSDDNKRKNV